MCIDMGLGCHYAHIIHVLYLATFRYGVAMMNFVLLSFPDSIVVTHKRRAPHGLQLFLGECAIAHPLRDLRPDDDRTEHRPCGCCSCAQYSGRPCPQSIQHRRRSHRARALLSLPRPRTERPAQRPAAIRSQASCFQATCRWNGWPVSWDIPTRR